MTDPNVTLAPKTEDNKFIENLINEQNAKIERIADLTAQVLTKAATPPPVIVNEPKFQEQYQENPEVAIEQKIKHEVSKAKNEALQQIDASTKIKELTAQYDKMADEEFTDEYGKPLLLDKTSEFYKFTSEEYNKLSNKQAPDAVYNAASRAYTKLVRMGKIIPKKEALRMRGINDSYVEGVGGGRRDTQVLELSEQEKVFAERLGLDPTKYLERKKQRMLNK